MYRRAPTFFFVFRTILVRLSSLLVLLSSLYNVISSCTVEVDESEDGECEFAQLTGNILANETDDSTTCPEVSINNVTQLFLSLRHFTNKRLCR